jgi:uncharacterized protein (TIGR03000 family)
MNYGYYNTPYYSTYYSPYYYGYSTWSYRPWYGYYVTPYAYRNYGWTTTYSSPIYTTYNTYRTEPYAINTTMTPAASGTSTYRSFYSPDQGTDTANIRVLLPDPNARVTFDDTATQQMGNDRLFTSPPLDPNKTYTYNVQAMWMENGKEVTRSQEVKVQAGRQATADFRAPQSPALPPPREDRSGEKRDDVPKKAGQ